MSDDNMRKIGSKEAVWFLAILFISKILFADINKYVNQTGTAAYLQTLWNAFIALVLFIFTAYLSSGSDLLSSAKSAFGSMGLKAVSVVLTLMLLINTGIMLRVYADIISSIVLPDYDDFFIVLFLIVAAGFAAFAGVGTLASYGYGAGIVLTASLVLILVLNIPNYDLSNVYPLFGNGTEKIFLGLDGLTVYADVFLIFLMSMYFKADTSVLKGGVKAIAIGGAVITATALAYILTIPYPAATEFTLPVLEIAFDVNLDVIFQRAEGVFLFLWIFSGFILIGTYLTFSLLTFEKGFNLSDRKAPVGAFLVIAASVALSVDAISGERTIYDMFYKIFTAVAFGLPLVVFAVERIRKGRGSL